MNLKQPNRTDHLLQKPDIFTCYRHIPVHQPRNGADTSFMGLAVNALHHVIGLC